MISGSDMAPPLDTPETRFLGEAGFLPPSSRPKLSAASLRSLVEAARGRVKRAGSFAVVARAAGVRGEVPRQPLADVGQEAVAELLQRHVIDRDRVPGLGRVLADEL